jgi:S-adenosylmethionine:tRNA ribosyltransferase-isomerase
VSFYLSDYTYSLPDALIAQEALHPHHDARLMVIDRASGKIISESTFWHLDTYIPDDRVIFFNNSRVLPARIRLKGNILEKETGEKSRIHEGEVLFLAKKNDKEFEALVRPGKKFSIGTKVYLSQGEYLEVVRTTDEGRILRAHGNTIEHIMRTYGELPLPPYIEYAKEKEDDYQTSFAKVDGSVAAPTASLHFTRELLEKIPNAKEYLTLHVGLGTFKPIDTADVREYHIHSELVEVSREIFDTIARLKNERKKVLAVGTTACRTLESLPYVWHDLSHDEKLCYHESCRNYWDTLTKNLEKKDFIA